MGKLWGILHRAIVIGHIARRIMGEGACRAARD